MGIVVVAIGKIDFGLACASACVVAAAPASASAPDVRTVLRSRWSMGILPLLFLIVVVTKKARAGRGPCRLLVASDQCLISGGSLPPLAASLVITCLCSQMFMLAESLVSPV